MNEVSGKNKIGRVILIIGIICLIGIGLSFGYYLISSGQDENNVAGSKCFKLELTNQSKEITLDQMYPISDEEGMSLTPYTFTLTNTCDIDASYSINLEMIEGTTLDSKYLDVVLNDSGIKLLTSYDLADTVISGSTESRILTSGTLKSKESKDYTLRFWMDKAVEDTNSMNKVFKSKIVVSAETTVIYQTLVEKVTELASIDTVNLASDDQDSNIRYIGANPDNYIYFNCSDYNKQSLDTCEKWRIIGLFNNITKSDGTKENLIKIIRDEGIGEFSFDYKNNGAGSSTSDNGSNDWSDSQLMMMLNPTDYLKNGYSNSNDIISYNNQELYSKMGSYYNGTKGCSPSSIASSSTFSCNEVDFAINGLKNDMTRSAIESVVWNLGGSASFDTLTPSLFYSIERGTTVYSNRPSTWTGKIGLMYPSDYGYATAGGLSTSRETCLSTPLYNWNNSDISSCKDNNYLFDSENVRWTLTPFSDNSNYIYGINKEGFVNCGIAYYDGLLVQPTIFLKSNITIIEGNGSEESPYQLKVE